MAIPIILNTSGCDVCAEMQFEECQSLTIGVGMDLEVSTDYKWSITDKFNNVYFGTSTTDTDKIFLIEAEQLPEGLLTTFAGNFTLRIYKASNDSLVSWISNTKTYSCISFSIYHGETAEVTP